MAKGFQFRQTPIAAAIATLTIQSRRTETRPDATKQQKEYQTMAECEKVPQKSETSDWLRTRACEEADKTTAMPVFDSDPKREQVELVKIIGTRMQEARELCNLSQLVAARRLGYANSSKLSKVEGATDTNSVPLWLIVRAAKVYEVSIDYLFGTTDEWEIGVPRGVQPWLLDAWNRARQRDMAALEKLHNEIAAVSRHTAELVAGIAEVAQALDTLRTRAPVFDELPASGTLAGRLDRLQERGRSADAALRRFRLGLRPESTSAP